MTTLASELRAMQSKTATRSRGVVMLAALLGVLLVTPALGQEPVEPDNSMVEPETTAPAESIDDAASPPVADPSGVVLDYEPTESISEDLSVSFPVDI